MFFLRDNDGDTFQRTKAHQDWPMKSEPDQNCIDLVKPEPSQQSVKSELCHETIATSEHEPGYFFKLLDTKNKVEDSELSKMSGGFDSPEMDGQSPSDDCVLEDPVPAVVGCAGEAELADPGPLESGLPMDSAAAIAAAELRARLADARARELQAFEADDFKSARAAWKSARAAIAAVRALRTTGSYEAALAELRDEKAQALEEEDYMGASGVQSALAMLASCTEAAGETLSKAASSGP